jgi:hypothetical protein
MKYCPGINNDKISRAFKYLKLRTSVPLQFRNEQQLRFAGS